MLHGTIKWYDADKGYGIIEPQKGDKDVIFRTDALEGFAVTPASGDLVIYLPIDPRRGTEAAKVHPA